MMRSRKGYARKVLYKFPMQPSWVYILSVVVVIRNSQCFSCVYIGMLSHFQSEVLLILMPLFLCINGQDFLGCLLLKHSFSLESNYLYMT